MPRDKDEYKEWQDRYEELNGEWDEDWSDQQKRDHYENMKDANERIHTAQVRYARHNVKVSRAKRRQSRELKGREEAREEWGDDGNDGHDRRVEEVKDQEQLLKHGIAHAEGEYDYQTERMGDMDADLRHELERENNEKWGSTEHAEGDNHEERGNEQETSDMEIESDSD